MGVREARCLHDSTPGKPAGPRWSPHFRREGAETELGEGEDTMTPDALDILTPSCWILGVMSSRV